MASAVGVHDACMCVWWAPLAVVVLFVCFFAGVGDCCWWAQKCFLEAMHVVLLVLDLAVMPCMMRSYSIL
jgi:hypothetical protein